MPVIKNPPKKKFGMQYRTAIEPRPDARYKMRVYRPGKLSPIDRFYKDLEQLKRYQEYYRNRGVKTRRI